MEKKCPYCDVMILAGYVRENGKCPACARPLTVDELLAGKLSVNQPAAVAEPA
ncbi:MAG: hypothetical protein Q8N81_02210 [bacterium]|nr:hypothetical protein [bacterium]